MIMMAGIVGFHTHAWKASNTGPTRPDLVLPMGPMLNMPGFQRVKHW